ncbi:MAG: FAD-dependent oxidoreductase [Hydrococcus sp. Prado102]|nr:FAD-dependent oxidoreductase [Hydrococcus sp. Prado102]
MMSKNTVNRWWRGLFSIPITLIVWDSIAPIGLAIPPRNPDQTVECDILVAGGGLAGSAAAYEALLKGKTVCLTEITDWVGGQISSQGTSALDERKTQRDKLFYPRGYLELRNGIEEKYGELNPGDCWVSESCYLPEDGHQILMKQLEDAAEKGEGELKWFPSTVIKDLEIGKVANGGTGEQIKSAIAIQHSPAAGAPPLNTEPLSKTIEDAYIRVPTSNLLLPALLPILIVRRDLPTPSRWKPPRNPKNTKCLLIISSILLTTVMNWNVWQALI